jgi:hypothetical protein
MTINLIKYLCAILSIILFSCGDNNISTVSISKDKIVGSWIYYKSMSKFTDSINWCEIIQITTLASDNSLWYSCSTFCSSQQADSALGLSYGPRKNGSWFIVSDSLIMTPSYTMCADLLAGS